MLFGEDFHGLEEVLGGPGKENGAGWVLTGKAKGGEKGEKIPETILPRANSALSGQCHLNPFWAYFWCE